MKNKFDENMSPEIENQADQWEEQQQALREIAEAEAESDFWEYDEVVYPSYAEAEQAAFEDGICADDLPDNVFQLSEDDLLHKDNDFTGFIYG